MQVNTSSIRMPYISPFILPIADCHILRSSAILILDQATAKLSSFKQLMHQRFEEDFQITFIQDKPLRTMHAIISPQHIIVGRIEYNQTFFCIRFWIHELFITPGIKKLLNADEFLIFTLGNIFEIGKQMVNCKV